MTSTTMTSTTMTSTTMTSTTTARRSRPRAAWAALLRRLPRPGSDRGDVPGWVLVTLMTAGLVTALWVLAGDTLSDVFSDAIKSVHG